LIALAEMRGALLCDGLIINHSFDHIPFGVGKIVTGHDVAVATMLMLRVLTFLT
jgi:hypothetical protein